MMYMVVPAAMYAHLEDAAMLADPIAETFRRINRGQLRDPLYGAAVVKQELLPIVPSKAKADARTATRGSLSVPGTAPSPSR